MKVITDW